MTSEVAELVIKRPEGVLTPDDELRRPIARFQQLSGENIDWVRGEVVEAPFVGAACTDDGRAGVMIASTKELSQSALTDLAQHCAIVIPALGLTLDQREPDRELIARILDEPINRREGAPPAHTLVDAAFSLQRVVCYSLDS